MPQEQEVLHIHIIKLTLAARERGKKREKINEENYIHFSAFRALDVFNAFFVCSKRFIYNLKPFSKCAKSVYIEPTSYEYGIFLTK